METAPADGELTAPAPLTALAAAETALLANTGFLRRLVVRHGSEQQIVDLATVECFVSQDRYTCIYGSEARELLTEVSLDHLEQRLDPALFCRIHRKAIARLTAVRTVSAGESPLASMASGRSLPVARRRRGELLARLAR